MCIYKGAWDRYWSEPTKLDTTLTVHMRRRTLEEKLEAIRLLEESRPPDVFLDHRLAQIDTD